ncbi:type II toxin-antitoxin system Phd/YefM family antitoxin [Veillonella caviae]|uniref:type II toxin-antitoxin system Phd/YefM family antitoxin n=2 Tax=Veillonella caviae TaxID=248316 RepID=UPI0023F695A1|nr:type II toxin-antitoxin system Phd/YefM family antitoxin [Veillonella caviae]MCI7693827.1 type II toxin-antitoxin system Phd/YefM family antitoxin [Veillonella caviae]MDY5254076.1 type II toxin-antitoxin system Phd/YefM family antitoxin [Veillonella caviae]
MGILRETIRPSSDLRNKYNEIASILRSSDEACIMTVNGRGDTVCMGYETYNKLKAQIELLEAIALSEEDEKSGRILDIQDTFDSIERILYEGE